MTLTWTLHESRHGRPISKEKRSAPKRRLTDGKKNLLMSMAGRSHEVPCHSACARDLPGHNDWSITRDYMSLAESL